MSCLQKPTKDSTKRELRVLLTILYKTSRDGTKLTRCSLSILIEQFGTKSKWNRNEFHVRQMKADLKSQCFTDQVSNQLVHGNKYVKRLTLKSDLSPELKQKCDKMTRTENNYLAYLRKKRSERLAGIFSALPKEDAQERAGWDVASDFKYEPV